ncbi:SCP2 sterol-binding domain-containing protein [Haloechinothrix aidingensis]
MASRFSRMAWLRRMRVPAFAQRGPRARVAEGGALDSLAGAIDLNKLSAEQFGQLIRTLYMLGETGSGVELSSINTDTFVTLVADASKDQLKVIVDDPVLRTFFIEEILSRMSDHLIEHKARNVSLVVSWRFTDGTDDEEFARYQTVIEDGVCVSGEDLGRLPDTTLTLSAFDFIRMATGSAAVAPMFITGRVKVKGDYSLAAMFSGYFDIPKPAGARG